MKTLITALAGACLMTTACNDFHTSDNGSLDGFWQLTAVDSLPGGQSADVRGEEIFWAVQANLLEVRDLKGQHVNVFFRFSHEADRLTLSDPVADVRHLSDSVVTDVATLRYYGLSHLTETLRVLRLDETKMALQSESLRMYFRKY